MMNCTTRIYYYIACCFCLPLTWPAPSSSLLPSQYKLFLMNGTQLEEIDIGQHWNETELISAIGHQLYYQNEGRDLSEAKMTTVR